MRRKRRRQSRRASLLTVSILEVTSKEAVGVAPVRKLRKVLVPGKGKVRAIRDPGMRRPPSLGNEGGKVERIVRGWRRM